MPYLIYRLHQSSHSIIQGHIPRWYFLVKEYSNLLNPNYCPMNPCDYQWTLENDELLPVKNLLPLPEELTATCSCKIIDTSKRCKGRCSCLKKGAICTDFCSCLKVCSNTLVASQPSKRKMPLKGSRRTRQRAD